MTSHLVFIFFRALLVAIVLLLHERGALQVNWCTIIVIALLIFKIIFEPYKSKLMNVQDIIGHFLILSIWITYYNMLDKSTELATSGKGYILGVICLSIIAIMILNFYLFMIIAVVYSRIRKRNKSYLVKPYKNDSQISKFLNFHNVLLKVSWYLSSQKHLVLAYILQIFIWLMLIFLL